MTDQEAFLRRLVQALDKAKIAYMLSGSLGSSFHGEPRATNDIDMVIAAEEKQLLRFVELLGDKYYVSRKAVLEACHHRSMFNIIDHETGWKADLIIRKQRPFSEEEFSRRKTVEVMGIKLAIASPEDIILIKLEWSKMAQSERQYQDALGVAAVQWENLDRKYLCQWAQQLNVETLLEKLLIEAEKLQSSE